MQNKAEFLQNMFKYFLKLSFLKKFFITYVACWSGFLSMVLFSKILYFLFGRNTLNVAGNVASQKFEVISGAVSHQVGYNYLSISLSYFISNSIACVVILLVFPLVAYLYKKDMANNMKDNIKNNIENNRSSLKDYLNTMILFYIITVINPLTGILGYNINIKDIAVLLPHGIFEFAGFALSIVMGITIANKILPLNEIYIGENKKDRKLSINIMSIIKGINDKSILKDMLKIIAIFILIGIAASLEPLDWLIYEYAKYNNLNIIQVMVEVYRELLFYIF
ncbi:hypothetical protein [Methanothermococcus okinawensis]|uniref:Stage II sporulation protein M n=1 Tax=Methanothermococcus okinawensis (strain DSM 14208 / JCM 11175 / IH1) TaxID=647113 RepID=F8AJT7_METOI|nr:hypothetical protein [Methanothermococcus okinawensis]AEH07286.1 hypothetical protein Metok_1320 [Methanothermococcus okinawensis IH1]